MTVAPGPTEDILVVGPYAPYRDGIAAYVVQQVRDLRRLGHRVEVLSPVPSAAHHHLDLHQPRNILALRHLTRRFDRVIQHFHPDYYFPQPTTFAVRATHAAALSAAIRSGPPATLVLHEIDERWGLAHDAAGMAVRSFVRAFDVLEVHDEAQATQLRTSFGADPSRIRLVDHGAHFVPHTSLDRAGARAALGLDPDAHVSLCIGFVAEHKGFDRAVTAFGRATSQAPAPGGTSRAAELHVVGSPSVGSDAAARYLVELASLAEATPGVTVHDTYVSDATFDRWLAACDLVVLPYRYIWSSGVAERAALFGRPVLATRVGGLEEQLAGTPGNRLVDDDHGLAEAFVAVLAEAGVLPVDHGEVVGAEWQVTPGRADVLAEVQRRAERQRGFAFVADDPRVQSPGAASGTPSGPGSRAMLRLRQIGPLARPMPVSGRPGVTGFKRLQRRLLDWELEPIIGWVDELRRATQEAVEAGAASPSGSSVAADEQPPTRRSTAKPSSKKKRPSKGQSGTKPRRNTTASSQQQPSGSSSKPRRTSTPSTQQKPDSAS